MTDHVQQPWVVVEVWERVDLSVQVVWIFWEPRETQACAEGKTQVQVQAWGSVSHILHFLHLFQSQFLLPDSRCPEVDAYQPLVTHFWNYPGPLSPSQVHTSAHFVCTQPTVKWGLFPVLEGHL